MKKLKIKLILLVILLILSLPLGLYVFDKIYYFNRVDFLSPIDLKTDYIPIRHDSHGQGDFAAPRRGRRVHQGIDILAEINTPVQAVKSGRAYTRIQPRGLGKYIEIIHSDGLVSIYAHLSNFNILSGQKVRQGQIIGFVGRTGNAQYRDIRTHLHFEIRKNGRPVDPLNGYLKPVKIMESKKEGENKGGRI